MICNGLCSICPNPCYRGEIKVDDRDVPPISPEEEKGASEAFDSPVVSNELSIVDNIGTYEVRKNIFGKEKVRRVK